MGASSHFRLAWAVLTTGLMTAMGDKSDESLVALPAVFEVDLLFPHNATYAPSALMPILFAVQNPTLAPSSATITFDLWRGNDTRSPGSVGSVPLALSLDVATERQRSNEPLLLNAPVNTIAYPDGVWTLAWSLEYFNCSTSQGKARSETFYTVFTVSKSGQAPDMKAGTSADVCGSSAALAYNVTSWDELACGMPGPSPTTNPCSVTVDSAAVSSLSALARATGYVCSPNSNITCPTSFSSSGSPRVAAVSTLLTLSAALTVLIQLR
ncbi:uncharacterized protein TRIREDRAFT_105444 [Trichoderma reesei QM6a]|jgi:hypothetical protein|uniref:Predicted protein n=2 Tax=Hypocrea jecorina TaxID=51453 RepID=G0REJ9_HYPJQ|nr:uncharacterized protein TRIREDRAFT_105444 [Trichoderma reesei QM6a]EGR50380.1 predicted protein [Trichoderma reesei QM6a]ETS03805.1 hypothetical protein M419DRAFT_74442 [Trichoderma reesei RUT C-30]